MPASHENVQARSIPSHKLLGESVLPDYSRTTLDVLSRPLDDVFLVPGQGVNPYHSMASDSLAQNHTVERVLAVVDSVAREHGYPAVTDLVIGREDRGGHQGGAAQLATYAASVAVLALLREHGVHPSAVVAQSLGEVAGWVAVGSYSVESGTRAVCFMNDAHAAHPFAGGLVLASTDEQGARELIERVGSADLAIAGLNTARHTLLSGGEGAVRSLLDLADQPGVPALRRLPVPYLMHHPRLEPVARQFEMSLRTLPMNPPEAPLYSVVGRNWYADAAAFEEDDFHRRLAEGITKPMYLREALEQFSGHLPKRFVELGPGNGMARATRAVLPGASTVAPLADDTSWLSGLVGPSRVAESGH